MKRHNRYDEGFSLIEMMVTVAIMGAVTVYMGAALTNQNRAYTVVDSVTESQQNLRAVSKLMEREIRTTGFLVPEAGAICGYDTVAGTFDADPDVLFVGDSAALDPAGVSGLQLGVSVLGAVLPNFGAGTPQTINLSDLELDGNPFYDLDGDNVADSDFLFTAVPNRQGGVIFADRADPSRGTACGLLTNVDIVNDRITVDFTVAGAVPNGSGLGGAGMGDLIAIPAHVYWIATPAGQPPILMRDGMVLAPDVEDLQIALFYDVNDNGNVDGRPAANIAPPFHSATEYPGSNDAGSEYVSSVWDNSQLREVRVDLVARTRAQDVAVAQNPNLAFSLPQLFENRQPWGVADGFRRRSITLTVQPRNVGSRAPGL